MTKEEIQEKIDHYHALAEGYQELHQDSMMMYYMGKADSYIDIIKEEYPNMEKLRAFPLDQAKYDEIKQRVKFIHDRKCMACDQIV